MPKEIPEKLLEQILEAQKLWNVPDIAAQNTPPEENLSEPFFNDSENSATSLSELFGSSDPIGLSSATPPVPDLSNDFDAFVSSLNLRYFKAFELLRMGGQNSYGPCAGMNRVPTRSIWANIVPTIFALDEVRHDLGYAIKTTSVFRHPKYNECLRKHNDGVAKNSRHLYFNAIDFQGASGTPTDWHNAVLAFSVANPRFGIWTRKYSNFVHIDTRGFH